MGNDPRSLGKSPVARLDLTHRPDATFADLRELVENDDRRRVPPKVRNTVRDDRAGQFRFPIRDRSGWP
jgi:hypothetical protein